MKLTTFVTILFGWVVFGDPNIWPLPSQFTVSDMTDLAIDNNFTITTTSKSKILENNIDRYMHIIFEKIPMNTSPGNAIKSVTVTIKSDDEDNLQYGVDESYQLILNGNTNTIESNTVWGALRGLETLSQIIVYNNTLGYYTGFNSNINDKPRFSWRGILIDTSRHYQSVNSIKRLIDSMSYAKFNVLHWHIVDEQSFPYCSVKYPTLCKGSWNGNQYLTYTLNDLRNIVQFAKQRGIRVVPEFDIPGHSLSWCVGLPEICESQYGTNQGNCGVLNPSVNITFEVINNLLSEASEIFFDDYLHIGGDEVSPVCYETTESIQTWMNKTGLNGTSAILYFDLEAINIVKSLNKKPVNWVEVFDSFKNYPNFNNTLTVIEVWKTETDLTAAVKQGYRSILADNDKWYFDNLGVTWDTMYMNEPFVYINNATQEALVLGGEGCMWGETVDVSDIEETIWPRAAAVAERLWSPRYVNNTQTAHDRIQYFRCLLNQRGIEAAPVNNKQARAAPPDPGNCYLQR